MKNQTVILLVVAGACGLVAMLGVKQYLAKQNQKEDVPKVQVLVAASPIKQGVPLTETNTQFITVEKGTCPEGVVTELEQIRDRSLHVPRGQGDWILVSQLSEPGAFGAVTGIPEGMRVITIPVDAQTNHSGMLQPGNRIDLLLTYRDRDPATGLQKEKTIPLMEYVEVFAVEAQVFGRDTSNENAKARHISLLVDTEQAMKLTLAKKKGVISTILRSNEDMDKIKIAEVTEDALGGVLPGDIAVRSTREVKNQYTDEPMGFALPTEEEPTDIMAQLRAELESNGPPVSAPVVQPEENSDDFWTMAIHEAGAVRVEKVNTKSEEPVDTRSSKSPAAATLPTLPASAVPLGIPGTEPATGADDKSMEELEEAFSGILDQLSN